MVGTPKTSALRHFSHLSRAHLAIFVLVFAFIGGYALMSSHAAGSAANLWVDPSGGACIRSASPAAYNDTTACASLDAAFSAAQSGDLVLIKCGTYPSQQFNTVRTSGNVTFRSEMNKCAVFDANGSTAIGFSNKVGYLTVDSVTVNGRIIATTTTGTGNNNITVTNSDVSIGKKVNGPVVQYSVGHNFNFSHNTIGPSCCGYNGGSGNSPVGIRIGKPSIEAATCLTEACNVTLDDNLIQYTVRNCQFWPSGGFGACPDTTCTNAVGCHMDGIQIWGLDGANITRNRLYGVECQGIFFQTVNNSLQRNINIINNAISSIVGGCSNKGIYLDASGSTNNVDTGYAGTWNIAFNSGSTYIMGPNNCGSCQTGTHFNITGNNIELDVTNSSGNNAGCGTAAWGVATVTYNYNVWRQGGSGSTNAACGSHDILANPAPAFINEVSPPGTGIDLHLASASSVARGFVPASVCSPITAVDFDNDPRPAGAACDAGADQYGKYVPVAAPISGNNGTGQSSSVGSSSPASSGSGNPGSPTGSPTPNSGKTTAGSSGPSAAVGAAAGSISKQPVAVTSNAAKETNQPAVITFSIVSATALGAAAYLTRKIRGRWLW